MDTALLQIYGLFCGYKGSFADGQGFLRMYRALLQIDRAFGLTFRARFCQWTLTTHKVHIFRALLADKYGYFADG